MIKFKSKLPSIILACVLVLTMLASTAIPAFAATASIGSVAADVDGTTIVGQDIDQGKQTEYKNDIKVGNNAITENCDVYATVLESDIVVTVPKVQVLDGAAGSGNSGVYTVAVRGDIPSTSVINVVPQDEMDDRDGVNFEMSSAGKDNIPTDVVQEKTKFTYADGMRADVAATTTGVITAYGMTAGIWNGDFMFNISVTTEDNDSGNNPGDTPDTPDTKTEYTLEEIENSEYLFAIGKTQPEYVVAEFDQTFTSVNIFKNGEESDGLMANFATTSGKTSPMYDNKATLETVTVESGVTSIGDAALCNLQKVTEIVLPEGIVSIGSRAFANGSVLENVSIPSTLETIGTSAFNNCRSLKNANLPDGLKSIGNLAFFSCESLNNVTIPASVTSIGYGPFATCFTMTAITVDEENEKYVSTDGVLYTKSVNQLVQYPAGKTDVSYTVPSTVTTVGSYAACENYYLETLVLPEGLTKIDMNGFSKCEALTNINLPSTITTLGHQSFYGCRAVDSVVTIPANLTSIGTGSFSGAGTAFVVEDSNAAYKTIGDVLFTIDGKTLLQYPAGSAATTYTIPDGTETVAEYSFSVSDNLTEIVVSDEVTTIGRNAFEQCHKLVSITIPASVTSINNDAFYKCIDFETIKGVSGSYAEEFANSKGYAFEAI